MKASCIIVEDEPLAADRLVSYISKFPILDLKAQFENGTDALVYLSANKVDLIFLDINMPLMSGFEMAEQATPLIGDKPSVVLVMLTSSDAPSDRERAASLPIIQGFVTKPLTTAAVRAMLAGG